MNKQLSFICVLLFSVLIYGSNGADSRYIDPVVIEITDTTLNKIYYHQNAFTEPTKLVFTNLTSVTGTVYFHQNTNLVEVDFPKLVSTEDYLYFSGNKSLEIINAPNLTSIKNYIFVEGHSALQELNVCNLEEIVGGRPYYYIDGNNAIIDETPFCFSQGPPENLEIDNTTVKENEDLNTLVGTLSADSNYENGQLTYYVRNSNFTINGNQLLTNSTFDFESKNEYNVKIGVINQLGEKIERNITINVSDVVNENIKTVEITDTTLNEIYYHQNAFTEPTKLVFTNLTSVTGTVYFHQNTNLVEVDFPKLVSTEDYLYFSGNKSLEIINAPNLTSIKNYIFVEGHSALQELNVCNLEEIVGGRPYYYIDGNNAIIDETPFCFSQGPPENIEIDNATVKENEDLNTLIGTLSAFSNYEFGSLKYFVNGVDFVIDGNQLLTKTPLDFESKSEYNVKISVINQLGEKTERNITIKVLDEADESLTTIEILDSTLENVYYHKDETFITPTKLVFPNLTSVQGYVYFHENINLVGVEFPQLTNTEEYFYVNGNPSLLKMDVPNLETVYSYVYASKNKLLEEFNICNLSQILGNQNSYYYIKNNPNLDLTTTCLTNTYLSFNPVDEIIIKPAPNTLIGTFSSDAGKDIEIRYYFVDENGEETTNSDFVILDNGLYLAKEYSEYTEFDYNLDINALRVTSLGGFSGITSKKFEANQVREKIDLNFSFNIESASLNIKDVNNEKNVTIFPNPIKNSFRINSKISFDEISIYDLTGKHVKTFQFNSEVYNVSDFSSGLYFIHLKKKDDLTIYYKKIVIE